MTIRRFYECHACGHKWTVLNGKFPKFCPKCNSTQIMQKGTLHGTEALRYEKNPIKKSDVLFLRNAMRRLNITKLKVKTTTGNSVHPDIKVAMTDPPVIIANKVWASQRPHERRKRLTHELLHIKGFEHGIYKGGLVYHTKPEKDTLSLYVYQNLITRKNPIVESFVAGIGAGAGFLVVNKLASRSKRNGL